MKSFSELGLSESLMRVLPEMGFEKPSPIQEQAIPLLKEKAQDFIGLAQTGTGKTAAFGLPLLDWINPDQKETQALVLAPTRELGQQIASQLALFAKYLPNIQTQAVYGGASIVVQIKEIKRRTPQIVIATPGRLLDLMRRKTLNLSAVKFVVLDEADEMLNMGFKDDLDDILSYTGDNKNTWLFSATMPKEIRSIVKNYMHKPVEVKVSTGNQVNENIEHQFALVNSTNKFEGLKRILDSEEGFRGVIFCRTRAATQQLADNLKKSGFQAEALHGEMSQAQRDRVMKRFKEHTLKLLVATDVAARGIDVNDLTHVIHYSLPDDDAYYTHRSGRTARAGKKGISLSILTNRDMRKFDALEKRLKLKMTKISIPSAKDIASKRLYTWAENILNTPTAKDVDGKILTDVQMLLGSLSYEELVEKLVSIELNALNYSKSSNDLNANGKSERKSSGKKRERGNRDHKDKGKKADKKIDFKGDRFFINVGKMDDVTKRDLVEFIADTARIKKSDVGTVEIQKNCSFFEVNKKYSKKIANSFKGIYVDGRELRVNRDS
ncbi:MAG: ATP-dependent RNA helicase [Flavobacteriales bacterium]|nr:ATP-dependent RNA helicase [Flavobacteriales bacterium]